jgi:hypothetical protein
MYDQQTAQTTLRLVEEWVPSEQYNHERDYQSDLQEYLQTHLNQGSDMLGNERAHDVSTERGASRGDVVVNDLIGIELKRDFSNDQEKKLKGQLSDYQKEYDFVIACACGINDMDGWNRVKKEFQSTGMGFDGVDAVPVEFVHKPTERMGSSSDVVRKDRRTNDSRNVGTQNPEAADLTEVIHKGVRGYQELTTEKDTDLSTGEAVVNVIVSSVVLVLILVVVLLVARTLIV